jgi:hypothetical protein
LSLRAPYERRALRIVERNAAAATRKPGGALDHPHECEDRERERGPVHERRSALVREDRPERPRDRDRGRQVALGARECVRGRRRLEEEAVCEARLERARAKKLSMDVQSEEDKDLGPDAGVVRESVDAEGLECGQENEHGRPPVVERERQVHEELVGRARRLVMLLDNVVDVLRIELRQLDQNVRQNVVARVPSRSS